MSISWIPVYIEVLKFKFWICRTREWDVRKFSNWEFGSIAGNNLLKHEIYFIFYVNSAHQRESFGSVFSFESVLIYLKPVCNVFDGALRKVVGKMTAHILNCISAISQHWVTQKNKGFWFWIVWFLTFECYGHSLSAAVSNFTNPLWSAPVNWVTCTSPGVQPLGGT